MTYNYAFSFLDRILDSQKALCHNVGKETSFAAGQHGTPFYRNGLTVARGRPEKPYKTTWGELIPGLYHCPDGRWRINATAQKFTEPDERRVVQRFRAWQEKNQPGTVDLMTNGFATLPAVQPVTAVNGRSADSLTPVENLILFLSVAHVADGEQADPQVQTGYRIPESVVFGWLRQQLLTRPEWLAAKTGVPELAGLRNLPLPRPPIKLAGLSSVYVKNSPAKEKSKREALAVWNQFVGFCKAKTLDDLTQETLMVFREHVEQSGKSSATKVAYYGRIKNIIAFGAKCGLDTTQINGALERAKVLWTATKPNAPLPHPISKEDFRKLLNASNGSWRPWLLCAMNFCMHLDEVCSLRWEQVDLEKRTLVAIREKTADKRIPRVAMLWKETVEALAKLPRKGQYVFTSSHGTRYNRNTRGNDFAELRKQAGVSDDVKFDDIRDAAYGAAAEGTTDNRLARVLAGHKADGWEDHYVLRNPQLAAKPCQAVYKKFGPF